jgi:hypothetical protein
MNGCTHFVIERSNSQFPGSNMAVHLVLLFNTVREIYGKRLKVSRDLFHLCLYKFTIQNNQFVAIKTQEKVEGSSYAIGATVCSTWHFEAKFEWLQQTRFPLHFWIHPSMRLIFHEPCDQNVSLYWCSLSSPISNTFGQFNIALWGTHQLQGVKIE